MILRITTEAQFHAIWNALDQFIDNQDDSIEEHEWSPEVQAQVKAAREFRSQFDATLIKLAEKG